MEHVLIIDRIAEKLDLVKTSHKDARSGIPRQSDHNLTETENRIISEVRNEVVQEVAKLKDLYRKCSQTHESCESALNQNRLLSAEEALSKSDTRLEVAERDMQSATAAYNQFKIDNNLQREAELPDMFQQAAFAFVIVVIEGAINMYFFAQGSELGFLGGFFLAFIFSLINVLSAFIAGAFCLRYMHHISTGKQFFGIIGFVLFCLICLGVVAMSAFYRGAQDELINLGIGQDLGRLTWDRAKEYLLTLQVTKIFASLNSALLFPIGLFCAILAIWKGYKVDDPYPRFGVMRQEKIDAEEHFYEIQEEFQAKLQEKKNSYTKTLLQREDVLDKARKQMITNYDSYKSAVGHIQPSQEATTMAQTLLNKYREANNDIRANNPPAYFNEYPTVDKCGDQDWTEHSSVINKLGPEIDDIEQRCRRKLKEIREHIHDLQTT